MKKKKAPALCPCGSLLDYKDCCGRFHEKEPAPDALSLMKSRYSAFVKKDADYLLRTWHESTRPSVLDLSEPIKWLGLEIVSYESEGDSATVSFIARMVGPFSRLKKAVLSVKTVCGSMWTEM